MKSRSLMLVLALTLAALASTESRAQIVHADTFLVTFVPKTPAHPWYGTGLDSGFSIDGVEGKELTLVRGRTYTFQMDDVSENQPFYFSKIDLGAGREPYRKGVTGDPANFDEVVTFRPTRETPDLLYYQSVYGLYTGGRIRIVDSLPTVAGIDAGNAVQRRSTALPNPCSESVTIRLAVDRASVVRTIVVDAFGRTVLEVEQPSSAGETVAIRLETAELASGLYLYHVVGDDGATRSSGTLRISH